MNKKGFTLIELLAVIVILAIVALIAVPTVLNIVENARKGAAKSSGYSYIKAVETYIITSELDRDKIKLQKSTKYNVVQNTIVNGKNYLPLNDLVELKGSKPIGSKDYITLDNSKNVIEGELTISGYLIIIKNGEIVSVTKGEKVEIESMTLNHTSQIMEKGSSFKLKPVFTPIDASNQEVTYTSNDENIVTVDDKGNVTAKNIGNAKIIVTSEENTSIIAECNITVIVTATGVTVSPSKSEIKIGETVQLTGTLIPSDVTSNALTWTSSDINIAVVDENGLVTGISKGDATITATTVNGKTSTSNITVMETELSSVVKIGDYVAYDAGTWTSSAAKPTSKGNFGGYTSGLNKANSVSWCSNSSYTTSLKGWRVLSVSGTTVTLVHAGTPECYYHEYGYSSTSEQNLNNRAISEYENTDYAQENNSHMMTYDEALAITGSTSSTTNDLRYIGPSGTTSNSGLYWLATSYDTNRLYVMSSSGYFSYSSSNSFGVRPVVVLKAGIKTTGKGTDEVGQEAWTLVKP